MASRRTPNTPPVRVRRVKSQYASPIQKPCSSSSSVASSQTSSTSEGYVTPTSSPSTPKRSLSRSGRSTPTKLPYPSSPLPSNTRKYKRFSWSSRSSSPSNNLNNESSSDEAGPSRLNEIPQVGERKVPQMPENSRFIFSIPRDIFQGRQTPTGLLVSMIWGKDPESLEEKMSEKTRLLCEAEEQLEAQNARALQERSEFHARIQALEERLSKAQEELLELKAAQEKEQPLPEPQASLATTKCSDEVGGDLKGPHVEVQEVPKQEETYEVVMWNIAAREREEARDQSKRFEGEKIALTEEKAELLKDKNELVEQLKSCTLEMSKQIEQNLHAPERQETEILTLKQEILALKQEESKLKTDKAELEEQLNACRTKLQAYQEAEHQNQQAEDPQEEPQDEHQESEDDIIREVQVLDDSVKRGEEKLAGLLTIGHDMAFQDHGEPGTSSHQDTTEAMIEDDKTMDETSLQQTLRERQAIIRTDVVPEPSTTETLKKSKSAVILSTRPQQRGGHGRTKVYKHRPKENKDSLQEKDGRRNYRSNSGKKQDRPITKDHRIQKQERGTRRLGWVRCLAHPRKFFDIYFNCTDRISGKRCRVGSSGRIL